MDDLSPVTFELTIVPNICLETANFKEARNTVRSFNNGEDKTPSAVK